MWPTVPHPSSWISVDFIRAFTSRKRQLRLPVLVSVTSSTTFFNHLTIDNTLEAMNVHSPNPAAAQGWIKAVDPKSARTYYANTGKHSNANPIGLVLVVV